MELLPSVDDDDSYQPLHVVLSPSVKEKVLQMAHKETQLYNDNMTHGKRTEAQVDSQRTKQVNILSAICAIWDHQTAIEPAKTDTDGAVVKWRPVEILDRHYDWATEFMEILLQNAKEYLSVNIGVKEPESIGKSIGTIQRSIIELSNMKQKMAQSYPKYADRYNRELPRALMKKGLVPHTLIMYKNQKNIHITKVLEHLITVGVIRMYDISEEKDCIALGIKPPKGVTGKTQKGIWYAVL
jgi:hypothetical protein